MLEDTDVSNSLITSFFSDESNTTEKFVSEHTLNVVLSGSQRVSIGRCKIVLKQGDFYLIRKNQFVSFERIIGNDDHFFSISVILSNEILKELFFNGNWRCSHPLPKIKIFHVKSSLCFESYICSLEPYFSSDLRLNKHLTTLKVKEIVVLLLEKHLDFQSVLFNFSTDGKIDLEAFMNQNYRQGLIQQEFASMTGRSLAVFKRDFKKIFSTTPGKWVLEKRLSDAYDLIVEKHERPTEIYQRIGFQSLSYFIRCFKTRFNITPNELRKETINNTSQTTGSIKHKSPTMTQLSILV